MPFRFVKKICRRKIRLYHCLLTVRSTRSKKRKVHKTCVACMAIYRHTPVLSSTAGIFPLFSSQLRSESEAKVKPHFRPKVGETYSRGEYDDENPRRLLQLVEAAFQQNLAPVSLEKEDGAQEATKRQHTTKQELEKWRAMKHLKSKYRRLTFRYSSVLVKVVILF